MPTRTFQVRLLRRPLSHWALLGFIGSTGLALFGTVVGDSPHGTPWLFSLPHASSVAFGIPFYACACLLVAAWVGIGVRARAGLLATREAWVLLGVWGTPMLLGPPLFSKDLYSYVAQGLIAHNGFNPYSVGPSVLGPGPVLESVASVWRHTPAPYGPLFVSVTRGTAALFGSSLVAEVLALRVLELFGVALLMWCLPRLARNLGADPGMALWLGVLSPLALFSFIASGHNDALMLGLLVAGLVLASENKPTGAILLFSLAATVKIPAAAAIAFVGMGWLRSTRGRERLWALARIVGVSAGTVLAVTWLSGLGWTWLGPSALRVPAELRVLPTPSVALGTLFSNLLSLLGLHAGRSPTITVTQVVFATSAVIAMVWLALQVRRLDEVQLLGCSLIVLVLASPAVWPWYLLWGLTLLAATRVQHSRLVAVGVAVAMLVVGPSGTPVLQGEAYLLVAGACAAGAVWLLRGRRWATVTLGSVV